MKIKKGALKLSQETAKETHTVAQKTRLFFNELVEISTDNQILKINGKPVMNQVAVA